MTFPITYFAHTRAQVYYCLGMKKIFITFAILSIAIVSHAAGWTTKTYDADPMKGTPKYVEYTYTDDNGNSFVFSTNNRENFVLRSRNSVFAGKADSDYIIGLVGFYTRDGVYETKMPIMLLPNLTHTSLSTDDDFINNLPVNSDVIKKVIDYIAAGDGNVRFIFTCYDGNDFDLMVHRIEVSDMVPLE